MEHADDFARDLIVQELGIALLSRHDGCRQELADDRVFCEPTKGQWRF